MHFLDKLFDLIKPVKKIRANLPFDDILVPGLERAVLWDYKQDSIPVWNYIKTLQSLKWEIIYCNNRYPEERRRLKLIKHNIMADYESKIDRIWNDQKTGTFFRKGEKFEPHQVVKQHNLVMWDGLTGYTEFISGESTKYFAFMKGGIGSTEPTFNDPGLENEVMVVDMRRDGDINSDGIVLKETAAFPPGVPNNLITEFCGSDQGSDGRVEYRVVISPGLDHKQGITFVQASHNTIFQAVVNKTE